jgi:predicted amidophosphoribosyltransferase
MPSLLSSLIELALPHKCAGCGVGGDRLCPRCAGSERPIVLRDVQGLRVAAAAPYRDGLRTALLAYKERNRRDLTDSLAHLLARAIGAFGPASPVLVPIPSTRSAARLRGGDHVLRLAAVAAHQSGSPLVAALRLGRSVRDSAGLDSRQRHENLAGAMWAAPPSRFDAGSGEQIESVLVVDDIVTTGATLHEGARALADAGWPVIGAAVIGSTVRLGSDRLFSGRPP